MIVKYNQSLMRYESLDTFSFNIPFVLFTFPRILSDFGE